MNFAKSLLAGLAGAAALNILHETLRKLDPEAPRLDMIGKQAVKKTADSLEIAAPSGPQAYGIALTGDLLTNATYYAAIGAGNKRFMYLRALGAGVSAGLAALKATPALGLNDKHIANSDKRRLMTVGYYIFGALVTACVMNTLNGKAN